MSRKIIGVTVGSPLPKPNLMQTDPTKGDYVKGKEEFLEQINVGGNVDLTGYATEQFVRDGYQPKGDYVTRDELPDSGWNVDLTGYATEQFVRDGYQPKGNYLTAVPDGYAKNEDIPTKPEDIGAQPSGNYLTEVPSGYATEEFVKNKIAEAALEGNDVDLSGYAQKSELPTKVSQLQNDSGYLTEHQDISGKLDASALPTAINTALAQAKASGEFDGKDGADGQPGKDGADGAPGEKGDKGDKGDPGEPGHKGEQGIQGIPGEKGEKGDTGAPGADGAKGDKGDKGDTGAQGEPGKDGANGKDGTSATHSWNGTVLTITSASGTSSADLKGAKGDKGDKGDTGATGSAGSPGADGVSPTVAVSKSGKVTTVSITDKNGTKTATINDGVDGSNGKDGINGYSPVKGIDYFDGKDGVDGKNGIDGKDGTIQNIPLFAETVDWLNENGDTSKVYVLPDGYIYAYQSAGGGVENVFVLGDSNLNSRVSSSGALKTANGVIVTNPIEVDYSTLPYTLKIRGVTLVDYTAQGFAIMVSSYDENMGWLGNNTYGSALPMDSDGVYSINVNHLTSSGLIFKEGTKYVRLGLALNDANVALTNTDVANLFIEDVQKASKSGFASTGHAFVPADYEDRIIDLENESDDHDNRLKVLEASDNVSGMLPDYWLTHLEEKSEQIQLAMEAAGRNKSAFLWYTDSHWPNGNSKKSPLLLQYLCKNTPMNKVNFGGDIVGDSLLERSTMSYVYDWRKAINGLPNHHSVIGNHDNYADYAYAFLIAPEESSNMVMGGDFYYYIDNPCEKTRYIYLDSGKLSMNDAETAFVIQALKDTPDGWHIVVISHLWFAYNAVSTPTVGGIPTYCQKMLNLFDDYNSRKSGAVTMLNAANTYDFKNCGGKVEFCIGGHIHVDHDIASTGGIPIIITTADANQNRVPDSEVDSGTVGTITESAVFGIIADYNSNKITVVGVGRGTDRVISY